MAKADWTVAGSGSHQEVAEDGALSGRLQGPRLGDVGLREKDGFDYLSGFGHGGWRRIWVKVDGDEPLDCHPCAASLAWTRKESVVAIVEKDEHRAIRLTA